MTSDTFEALSLLVSRRTNALRKASFLQLRSLPPLVLSIEVFRNLTVRLAVAVQPSDDGAVAVLVRGHVSPFVTDARLTLYRGFVKRPDGRWSNTLDEAVRKRLMDAIENGGPIV